MENGKKSVIVVEANPESARLTERLLVANGYRVRIASAGEDLAAIARAEGVATVLIAADTDSPDGFARTQTLLQSVASLPVVIIDGAPSVARALKAETVGAFDYLARPFPVTALRDALGRSCAILASARVPRKLLEAYLAENGVVRTPTAADESSASESSADGAARAAPTVRKIGLKSASAARRSQLSEEQVLLDIFAGLKLIGEQQVAELRERLAKQDLDAPERETLFMMLEAIDPDMSAKCQARLADLAKTPPVPLDMYPVLERNLGTVDLALLERYAAVPFGRIADQTLVALPNPASASARGELSEAFGGKCRFFICAGRAADAALAKIRKLREGGSSE